VLDLAVLSTFIPASLVIILSPGADTFLLLRYAIRLGRGAGFRSMLAILMGLSLVSLVLISGVGLVVTQFPIALDLLTYLGIGILLFLALTSVRAATILLRSRSDPQSSGTPSEPSRLGLKNPVRMSLITHVTNPKVLIFYLAFFPQFLGEATSVIGQLTLLSLVFLVVTTAWLVPLVFVASAARAFFERPTVAVVMEFSVAVVFLALAITLLFTL
jgi:threonine/homoserine/homoserine lactone efflux protein